MDGGVSEFIVSSSVGAMEHVQGARSTSAKHGCGIGISPARNRSWVLTEEDSDEDDDDFIVGAPSLPDSCTIRSPNKYILNLSPNSNVRLAPLWIHSRGLCRSASPTIPFCGIAFPALDSSTFGDRTELIDVEPNYLDSCFSDLNTGNGIVMNGVVVMRNLALGNFLTIPAHFAEDELDFGVPTMVDF